MSCVMSVRASGLSPHTRGNQPLGGGLRVDAGSIPAHTGEPRSRSITACCSRVYPRTHGGTHALVLVVLAVGGLSPHTRGNRQLGTLPASARGSIPAHTGEPSCQPSPASRLRVYPRTHGGTSRPARNLSGREGLSPHTRGNLRGPDREAARNGSIPAHTGEPWSLRIPPSPLRVYPRTHGGTRLPGLVRDDVEGLSPHTRGNRAPPSNVHQRRGSIPAHTGEPSTCPSPASALKVYPRTHGGTLASARATGPARGLSPHTRGNRMADDRVRELRGSIPAHTGEPGRAASEAAGLRVYPRTHGGTAAGLRDQHPWPGLSPHTRGNQLDRYRHTARDGSIPAHTGEP